MSSTGGMADDVRVARGGRCNPAIQNAARHLVTATYRVDFSVHQGDRYVILGPSGCGKSTLLKAVGGFMRPVEGSIHIRGREIDSPGPIA